MEYIPAKSIVNRTKDPSWFGSDYTMNIYRGCCHGCIYCDSRSECYHIENFDQVRAKADALRILRDDLARLTRPAFITLGSMSDPYNPFEEEPCLTRHTLELIDAYLCGVAVATKSDRIIRDADILRSIQTHSPVVCKVTVTTADDALAAELEPGAPSPSRRLAALAELSAQGVFCGVLLTPVLPFLEDSKENVLDVVEAAARAGARFVYAQFGVTLRGSQRAWYYDQLEHRFPGRGLAARYAQKYGERYWCASPRAKALWEAFSRRCEELGLLCSMKSIICAATMSYGDRQLTFFD